ncbi:Osmotically-inducible protein OsmY, contains BON domain [Micromonospora pattaloongensis]|uniref:Osmotically-inducible protein OsmY, contains BON domain n=1 Tax=Micromonospora pattaloongensis TaxID=405436 RepID=A0A1H3RSU7_9ACTN|nr:BON domain-containing protein [Micromonospora pattaloongensis]SDZ28338.1 Osmotically-inducible protein OsmY, contains BON domain [Micromonospora pattaloongensis]
MTTATRTRTDEEVQRDVLDELQWDARVQPNEIGVAVRDGVVTLMGWVDNYGKKWAAERTAHRVRGVTAVANDVEVRLPSAHQRTDTDIAAAATGTLEWDAFVPIERLDVTVTRGWLTLKGEVEWEFQRRAAEQSVRRLAGVRGVTNLIAVQPRINPSPTELRRRLTDALRRSAETDPRRVTVDTDGGTVLLGGTVRSWVHRAEAERISWCAPGVTAVQNDITVDPGA